MTELADLTKESTLITGVVVCHGSRWSNQFEIIKKMVYIK